MTCSIRLRIFKCVSLATYFIQRVLSCGASHIRIVHRNYYVIEFCLFFMLLFIFLRNWRSFQFKVHLLHLWWFNWIRILPQIHHHTILFKINFRALDSLVLDLLKSVHEESVRHFRQSWVINLVTLFINIIELVHFLFALTHIEAYLLSVMIEPSCGIELKH